MSTETTNVEVMTPEEHRIKCYEALFMVSQGEAADLGGVIDHINEMLAKHELELLGMKKWDERRLAYEIDKQKRAVFLLVFLRCHTSALAKLEREINLSERIMRVMITKADHLTIEEMQSADAREDLAAEAKLRAEKAAAGEEAERRQTVTLGAPKREEAPAPAPAEGAAEPASGEASGECSGESPAPAAEAEPSA